MTDTGWTVAAIAAASTLTGAVLYTVLRRQEQRLVAHGVPGEAQAPPPSSLPSPPPPPGHDVALASISPPPLPEVPPPDRAAAEPPSE